MHTLPATGLRQQAEMLASLSLKHLSRPCKTPRTRMNTGDAG
ncbi:hypothetical protein EPIRMAN_GEN20615_16625 [Ralstonia mannitolilytica]